MNKSTTISKIISALLVLIFALSITPVAIIHKLAANHTDISYRDNSEKKDQYSKAGINCTILNFVAEAPFLNFHTPLDFTTIKLIVSLNGNYKKSFYTRHHFYAELRGPPLSA